SHSGLAGIAHWLNSFFRLIAPDTVDKQDPLVLNVKEKVDALFAEGRNTVMGDEELEIMVRDCDVERYGRLLARKSC
ncbi:MAG: 2-isopropylmalate synthase, partial [Clostridia bacterium]